MMDQKFQDDDKSSPETIDGDERPVYKTGVDKLAFGDGPVQGFYDPPHERVDRKKNDSLEYTYTIKYHYDIFITSLEFKIKVLSVTRGLIIF
jgi:hypothetical protein